MRPAFHKSVVLQMLNDVFNQCDQGLETQKRQRYRRGRAQNGDAASLGVSD